MKHRTRSRGLALARRASWNVGDQILSAVTNVAMSFLVARAVDARGFGAFSVAFVVFSLAVGAERSLVGQPLSIVHSRDSGIDMNRAIRGAAGTAVTLGLACGAICVVAGAAIGGVTSGALVAVGVVLPGLLLQDCCRMIFFAQLRPAFAALNDGSWAVVQFSAMTWITLAEVKSAAVYVLAWGGAASFAALVGLVQLRHWPSLGLVRWWVTKHGTLSGYLIAEYLLGTGSYQSSIFLVGALGGVEGVGALRAAQVLIGPVVILGAGMSTFALPELARRENLTSRHYAKAAALFSGVLFAATAVYGGLLLLVPSDLGEDVLGDTWTGADRVLLAVIVGSLATAACAGPGIVAYAMGQARIAFRLHMIEAPLLIACVLVGFSLDGVRGAAWGLAVNFALMLPLWVRALHALLSKETRPTVTTAVS